MLELLTFSPALPALQSLSHRLRCIVVTLHMVVRHESCLALHPQRETALPLILEGIVTTLNGDSSTNISPMGPIVDQEMHEIVLRPFQSSTTYQNLKRTGQGIFHVTDDALLIARAAINRLDQVPALRNISGVETPILADACRWFAFEVSDLDDGEPRTTIRCRVVRQESQRAFFGFNRAKHAVLEVAILATRIHILDHAEIRRELEKYRVIVDKTAGPAELAALDLLEEYILGRIR
jgi:hypothetical protein